MFYLIYLIIILLLIIFDQVVKYFIVQNFSLYESLTIIKDFFNITYIQNYGAGFSIFQNQRLFLIAVAGVALIILCYLLLTTKKNETLSKISYLLLIGGTLGNLIDRIRLGYVVDFLDFNIFGYDFPIFNIADCFITIGCFLIIIIVLREDKHAKD